MKERHPLTYRTVVFLLRSWINRAKCRPIPMKVLQKPINYRHLMLTPLIPSRKLIHLHGRCMNGSVFSTVQYGFYDRLVELTDADPNVPTTADTEGITLLHWAALNNRVEIAKYLISKGAKVDAVGGVLKSTPLHWAIREGKVEMVVLLIANNAQVSLVDQEGTLILNCSASRIARFSCSFDRFFVSSPGEYIRIHTDRRVFDCQRARSERARQFRHYSANACRIQHQKVGTH